MIRQTRHFARRVAKPSNIFYYAGIALAVILFVESRRLALLPGHGLFGWLRFAGYVGFLLWAVDRKRKAEHARWLSEAELRVRTLALQRSQKLARLGLWTWKPSNGESTWSQQVYDIIGLSPRDFSPSYDSLLVRIHPEDLATFTGALNACAELGTETRAEFRITTPSEEVRHCILTCEAEDGIDGPPERIIGILQDITDRKTTESLRVERDDAVTKLTHAAKMAALGEMAGGIAHEINTPLSTIKINAEQLEELVVEDPLDRPTVVEKTKLIQATVTRISLIIQGLRTFSRNGVNDRFEAVPLRQIIDTTLNFCSEKLKHAEIQVSIDSFPENQTIYCQPIQLSQVILNLISNAADAITDLPLKWIRIGFENQGDFVLVKVTDSGQGISPKMIDKIFQPFFTTKEIGKGTGLGLSISKGIVDSHHGSLFVDTRSQNTCFVVKLPNPKMPAKAA